MPDATAGPTKYVGTNYLAQEQRAGEIMQKVQQRLIEKAAKLGLVLDEQASTGDELVFRTTK